MSQHALLHLLQLSDSALPIGGTAHSFGLESLVANGTVSAATLGSFLRIRIAETLKLEAAFCRQAGNTDGASLNSLNRQLSARMAAREPRNASLALGRRFWKLFASLYESDLPDADAALMHHAVAFGAAAGCLAVSPGDATLAWMQQSITAALSAATRLLPIGQTDAQSLLWDLADDISAVSQSLCSIEALSVPSFAPALDIACMTHPALETRLFIS